MTCGANSFLLRDSACDKATNNALCLYDGGACCLEAKITTHCKNCSCILDVDQAELLERFLNLKVAIVDVDIGATEWTVKVEEVASTHVCALVCLDHERKDFINPWRYARSTRLCMCGWTESTKCPENLAIASPSNPLHHAAEIEIEHGRRSYVQLKKTISCG